MPGPHPDLVNHWLGDKLESLCRAVLPEGEREGRPPEWVGHSSDGRKWAVALEGDKKGAWLELGASKFGGRKALGLVAATLLLSPQSAYRWALDWLDGKGARTPEPYRKPAAAPANDAQKMLTIRNVWAESRRFEWSEGAGRYLQGRGIDANWFRGSPFGALRFAPRLFCAEINGYLPAMLGIVQHPCTGKALGLHRTYLEVLPGGDVVKARIDQPKKFTGSIGGGIIALHRGETELPWRSMPAGSTVLLAEGIENALSLAGVYPEDRSAAYLAAGNLLALELPEAVSAIRLVRDNDGLNPAITDARAEAIDWWEREGRTVEIWEPPPGIKDANDWIRERR